MLTPCILFFVAFKVVRVSIFSSRFLCDFLFLSLRLARFATKTTTGSETDQEIPGTCSSDNSSFNNHYELIKIVSGGKLSSRGIVEVWTQRKSTTYRFHTIEINEITTKWQEKSCFHPKAPAKRLQHANAPYRNIVGRNMLRAFGRGLKSLSWCCYAAIMSLCQDVHTANITT